VNKLFIYLILIIPISSQAERFDPNQLVSNVVDNNLNYTDKKACNEEESKLQAMARSCITQVCGPTKNIKSAFLNGEMFEKTNFQSAELDFSKKKESLVKAYENNRIEKIALLEELISRIEKDDDLEFSNEEASKLLFSAIKPNLNIIYNADTGDMNITYDEIESRGKDKKKVVGLVIDWIKENAKENIELRHEFDLPISKEEYVEYMEDELPKMKTLIDSANNVSVYFIDQIEYLTKNFFQNKNSVNSPDILFRNNILFLKNLKSSFKMDTGLGDKKEPMKFCRFWNCRSSINKQFKNEILPGMKRNLANLKEPKRTSGEIIDDCKSLFYQHEYNYQVRNRNNPQEVMSNFGKAYQDFSRFINLNYSQETAQIFNFKAQMLTNLKISGLPVANGVVMRDGLDFLQSNSEWYKNKKTDKKVIKSLSDFMLISNGINSYDFMTTVSNSCFGVTNGIVIGDDYYNSFTNDLNISAFSCEHPKAGRHVIAHELGHVFRDLVAKESASKKSSSKYIDNRKCVGSRNLLPNYKNLKVKYLPEDHYHSDEDMADYLENKTYKDLKTLGNPDHFRICNIFPIQNELLGNIKLDFTGLDPHSPPFFRLLNTLTDKGINLPNDCLDVLAKVNHLYKPVDCN
jgi:hypothetical protein